MFYTNHNIQIKTRITKLRIEYILLPVLLTWYSKVLISLLKPFETSYLQRYVYVFIFLFQIAIFKFSKKQK